MYRIEETTVSDKTALLWPLLVEHRDEIAVYPEMMEVAPRLDVYATLEAQGGLFSLVAYEGDEVIGYSINFLGPHMHYAECINAQNDVLFVRNSHRKGRVGLELIRRTEQLAKAKGAMLMLWHAKERTALAEMLPRLEYRIHELSFSRRL